MARYSDMAKVEIKWLPGMKVWVKGIETEGIVDEVSLRGDAVEARFKVVYWRECQQDTAWVRGDELEIHRG